MHLPMAKADGRDLGPAERLCDIAHDGTVTLTDAAKSAVQDWCPALGEPLHPLDALDRFSLLRERLAVAA